MARPPFEFRFGYTELANLCEITPNSIAKHVSRGNLVPDDLLSVATFLAAHGAEDVRLEIVTAFARMGKYQYRGRPTSFQRDGTYHVKSKPAGSKAKKAKKKRSSKKRP